MAETKAPNRIKEKRASTVIAGSDHRGAAADMSAGAQPPSGPAEQDISAENCYELLARAKRDGADAEKERLYGYMSAHFLQVLRNPAVYGRLTAGERELILARRMEGREVLAVAETWEEQERGRGHGDARAQDGAQDARRVLQLRPDPPRWEPLTQLPAGVPARGSGMATLYNYLFVAGGVTTQPDGSSRASDQVFCFNPLTGAWSRARALTQPRCQLRLVSLDGHLYAIGGECLFSVERYDPRADRWRQVAPLPKGSLAVAHEAAACGGGLFVSGGSLFYRLLRYDPRRDDWEECPFTESRRRAAGMVARRGVVYRFDVDRERAEVSVDRYNTVVKVWLGGASFPLTMENQQPFRCALLGDRVYCVSRSHVLQFELREEREGFLPEVLPAPGGARGALEPFVLTVN
ncbi:kelch repeat and BTB domain-containing protein 11-like [Cololabis saira]|uniref:kelch repeat and BTB domain-containing protein 11-like n=1 Tax=Cololabis saira TaxID=129043 RepID=UPI002AD273ED|nr:kelch repeat and BTB domain-containing protein 11-like [Cololabis saira]